MKWLFEKLCLLSRDIGEKKEQALKSRNWVLSDILNGQLKIIADIIQTTPITGNFPSIVCLCGSTRFMEAFQEANLRFTCEGEIVLSVGTNTKSDAELTRENYFKDPDIKVKLDELHKRKIDLCDRVFVLNVGGYIGESTRSEIDYATKKGKPISYLENIS